MISVPIPAIDVQVAGRMSEFCEAVPKQRPDRLGTVLVTSLRGHPACRLDPVDAGHRLGAVDLGCRAQLAGS